MCFTVQLSMFIFGFALVASASCILAHCFWFVKNFFNFFYFLFPKKFLSCFSFSSQPCVSYQMFICLSTLFLFYFLVFQTNGEGGIWTLAPLLTTYSLSRGAPSASLGTSPNYEQSILYTIFLVKSRIFLIWLENILSLITLIIMHILSRNCGKIESVFSIICRSYFVRQALLYREPAVLFLQVQPVFHMGPMEWKVYQYVRFVFP